MSNDSNDTSMVPVVDQLPSTPEDALAFISGLSSKKNSRATESAAADLDIADILPWMKMSKDTKALAVKLGKKDEAEELPGTSKVRYICVVASAGSRALWAPEGFSDEQGNKRKLPVCRTGLLPTDQFADAETVGIWTYDDESFPPPINFAEGEGPVLEQSYRMYCNSCPFNKFESLGLWDEGKAGATRAKACNEGRTFFFVPCEKVGDVPGNESREEPLYFFSLDKRYANVANEHGVVRFPVSYGSNSKRIKSMMRQAVGKNLPLEVSVFELRVEHQELGNGYTVALMTSKLAGVLGTPNDVMESREHASPWAYKFIDDHRETDGVEANEDSEEAGF